MDCAITAEQVYYHFPHADYIARFGTQYVDTITEFEEKKPAFAHLLQRVYPNDTVTVGKMLFHVLHYPNENTTVNVGNAAVAVG